MKKLLFLLFLFLFSSFLSAKTSPVLEAAAQVNADKSRKFALLVGVTGYSEMNGLSCCVNDVRVIREQFLKLGFQASDIYSLESGDDPKKTPTKENIRKRLDQILKKVHPGDVLFFVFAGHGAENHKGAYICPISADPEDLEGTCIPVSEIMEKMDQSKARFKCLVVDACRDNPFYSRTTGVTSLRHIDDPPEGMVVFQSCKLDEFSREDPDLGLSLFTASFVDALSGNADSNKDGTLTLSEVWTYTTDQTINRAQAHNATQSPYLGGQIPDVILSQDLNRPKALACFRSAKNLRKSKQYAEAKEQIDTALGWYPEDPDFLDEREAIQTILQLQNQITSVLIPGLTILPPLRNAAAALYEKLWEQKGITGELAISPDGKRLAVSCGNDIKILNFFTGEVLLTLTGHTDSVNSVSWSPNSRLLASSDDDTIRIWDPQTGDCVKTLTGQNNVESVSWSPDGRLLTSGGWNIHFWDIQTGDCVKTLEGHTAWVFSVNWSPDGHQLASGGWVKTVRIWDAQTGKCVKTLKGHTDDVRSVSWSPNGRLLASGSRQTVRIWDAQTGDCMQTLKGNTGSVKSVHWSPDGKSLAAGAYWGLTVWRVK